MGIFERVSLLVRSNINELLDRAEDPEKTLDQIIRDMADAISKAKAQVAETIAQKNLVEEDLKETRKLAGEWQRKAELAVQRNSDDLAREALRRSRDYASNSTVYEHQLATQVEVVDKLKADLQALQSKYEHVVRSRQVLIARHRTAKAQAQVQKVAASLAGIDPTSELARMEEKIRLAEARARAMGELGESSLERRFAELEDAATEDVEAELAALKAGMAPAALPAGEEKP